MGTEYAIGYGRNPEEEKMKKLKDVDLIAVTFIILGLLAMLAATTTYINPQRTLGNVANA